jgi:hypothetical protein
MHVAPYYFLCGFSKTHTSLIGLQQLGKDKEGLLCVDDNKIEGRSSFAGL